MIVASLAKTGPNRLERIGAQWKAKTKALSSKVERLETQIEMLGQPAAAFAAQKD